MTGAISTVTTANLTASRALISNASGKIDFSSVTSTELGYVSGVTSNIQTQLNAKQGAITVADTQVLFSDGANNPSGDAGLTYNKTNDTLTIDGANNKRLILKANASQSDNLLEFQKSDGTVTNLVQANGTVQIKNGITGQNGMINLVTGTNPEIQIRGDVTNGYYPALSFYTVGGASMGAILGYGGIMLNPAAGMSGGSWAYYVNSTAFYIKSAYVGVHTVPLFESRTYQGQTALGVRDDGSITQYGSLDSSSTPLDTPTALGGTPTGSGSSLSAGTYYYRVSACNYKNESIASVETSVTITAGQNVYLTWTSPNDSGIDHFRVYRSTTSGSYPSSSMITPTAGQPFYTKAFTDTGQTPTAGQPKDSVTETTLTMQAWENQTGDLIAFKDYAGTKVSAIKTDGNIEVLDEAYGSGWNGSTEVPTKNAI